jgi:hypothetical protein
MSSDYECMVVIPKNEYDRLAGSRASSSSAPMSASSGGENAVTNVINKGGLMLIGGEGEKSVPAQATTKEKSSDVGRATSSAPAAPPKKESKKIADGGKEKGEKGEKAKVGARYPTIRITNARGANIRSESSIPQQATDAQAVPGAPVKTPNAAKVSTPPPPLPFSSASLAPRFLADPDRSTEEEDRVVDHLLQERLNQLRGVSGFVGQGHSSIKGTKKSPMGVFKPPIFVPQVVATGSQSHSSGPPPYRSVLDTSEEDQDMVSVDRSSSHHLSSDRVAKESSVLPSDDEEMGSASELAPPSSARLPSDDEEMGDTSGETSARAASEDESRISPEAHARFVGIANQLRRTSNKNLSTSASSDSVGEYASGDDDYPESGDGEDASSDASELQDALASIAGDRENDELDLTLEEPKRAKKRNAGLELRRVGPKAKQRHRGEVEANQRANAKRKRKESDEMGPPKKMLRGRAEKREGSDLENDPFAPPHKVINTYGMW